ncbi:MAG: hypothetical protein NTU44_13785 [Bacteroidetes bacterium]|nr:hypothetical protein [Bacteroidota bacterium]
MKNRVVLTGLILLLFSLQGFSQESGGPANRKPGQPVIIPDIQKELGFIQYLFNRNEHADALFLLNRLNNNALLSHSTQDTLNYLLGWSHYNLKNLDSSSFFLMKVTGQSPFYLKSGFFAAYDELFLGNKEKAKEILSGIRVPELYRDSVGSLVAELCSLELAGISLLERDFSGFEKQSASFSGSYYTLMNEQKNMKDYARIIQAFRKKSMWKAGLMSAIIPGSGKIYAGKKGEGIVAFLIVTSLGLVTYENFRKDGPLDVKTLFFGGVCSLYYIGNIWGSAYAPRRHNNEFYERMDNHILFDLHIPLRNIFN